MQSQAGGDYRKKETQEKICAKSRLEADVLEKFAKKKQLENFAKKIQSEK